MESHPQNPEFRNNPENFTHGNFNHKTVQQTYLSDYILKSIIRYRLLPRSNITLTLLLITSSPMGNDRTSGSQHNILEMMLKCRSFST